MADPLRQSQGPSAVRKGARPHPTYRNDANFGRKTGKLLNIGNLDRDEDDFEDFNQYLADDVFQSPPPAITPKPKRKLKTPAKPSGSRQIDLNERLNNNSRHESATPRQYFASASPGPPPSTSRRIGSHSRPLPAATPEVDYDSIPAPGPRKKAQASGSAGPSSQNRLATHGTAARAGPSTARNVAPTTPASKRKSKGLARDDVEEEDGDDDENNSSMSMASVVEPATQPMDEDDDDDSGPEAYVPPDDYDNDDMDVDREPEPQPIEDIEDELELSPSKRASDAKSKASGRRAPAQEEDDDDDDLVEDAVRGGRNDGDQDMNEQFDDQEPQQEQDEDEQEEDEPPKKKKETVKEKKARLAAEKKAKVKEKEKAKRSPLKSKDMNAPQVTKVKRNWNPDDESDDDLPIGLRRGKRQKFTPLAWWRGEHLVTRRPRKNEPPLPIVAEVVRMPDENPAPFGKKKGGRRGTTKPPSSRGASKAREVYADNPEEGWDAETEQNALVIDYDTKEQIQKVIAHTAAMVDPKTPEGASYSFQKIFMDGDFIAGGVLNLPVGGKKPNKGAKDNTYLFYCVEGALRVMIHRTSFVITTNGMFMVPRSNQYYLENIGDRECKLFFAQARKVTDKMIPSPTKGGSARPSAGPGGQRPSGTPQRIGAYGQSSPMATKTKKTWNKDVIR